MAKERKTPEQTVAELQAKIAQLEARKRAAAAKITQENRKKDTRRKILAGAIALEHAEHDKDFKAKLEAQISRNVTRDDDRALFGLAPMPKGAHSDA